LTRPYSALRLPAISLTSLNASAEGGLNTVPPDSGITLLVPSINCSRERPVDPAMLSSAPWFTFDMYWRNAEGFCRPPDHNGSVWYIFGVSDWPFSLVSVSRRG